MMQGRLHSIETMGLVDGPGIRTIFFLQGCPLRCAYCHNPDSQTMFSQKHISPEEVLKTASKYKPYYNRTGGGITFSGGEPLLQGEFLVETLKLLKENGYNTAIDTSGYGDSKYYDEILRYTDLILLDIKHFDSTGYKSLTGKSMNGFYEFIKRLDSFKGKVWIRHVMVPGTTDNDIAVNKLFDEIAPLSHIVEKIEVLPYHKMGLEKYELLGIDYTMADAPEMDSQIAKHFENLLNTMLIEEKEEALAHKNII